MIYQFRFFTRPKPVHFGDAEVAPSGLIGQSPKLIISGRRFVDHRQATPHRATIMP
jgi:hypothetical protein